LCVCLVVYVLCGVQLERLRAGGGGEGVGVWCLGCMCLCEGASGVFTRPVCV
jgi:hypothetical protein